MNERDLMDPDLRQQNTRARPQHTDPEIESVVHDLCRRSRVGYCHTRDSWAGEMRHHLHAGRSQGRWETARLDCVIFSGLIVHGMYSAGSGLTMRRAVSVREQMHACGYDIRRSSSS